MGEGVMQKIEPNTRTVCRALILLSKRPVVCPRALQGLQVLSQQAWADPPPEFISQCLCREDSGLKNTTGKCGHNISAQLKWNKITSVITH